VKVSNIIKNLLYATLILMAARCAHPVMPTGGPEDTTPPEPVEAEPPNYSTNFNSDRFSVTFNEFVNLENPRKEMFISPPLEKFPDTRVRGKSVQVSFQEELQPNTTYTIYFGDAIVDITEKNPKSNFEYVLSTGDEIDSLSVTGEVMDAFTQRPVEGILVMLYLNTNDTIPLDSLPIYVRPLSTTKTTETGKFSLNNLKDRPYKIFALADNNANYIYDLPNESIAFLDSLVKPEYMFRLDTVVSSNTTKTSESLEIVKKPVTAPGNFYTLHLFSEIDSTQSLLSSNVKDSDHFVLSFRYPPDSLGLTILEPDTTLENWFLKEPDENGDTLIFWMKGFNPDTLTLKISEKQMEPDTVRLIFKTGFESRRERKQEDKREDLKVKLDAKGRTIDYFLPLKLGFSRPVESFDTSRMILYDRKDTLGFSLSLKGPVHREGLIEYNWKQEEAYTLFIPDSTFTDIYGTSHDTTVVKFNTLKQSDYGKLELTVSSESKHQYLIHIKGEEGETLDEVVVKGDSVLSYPLIEPGNYTVKAMHDKNRNGQWDTGNYKLNLQPEKVYFYPSPLNLRPNWEVKETWDLP